MCFPFGGGFVRLKRSCKLCGFVADHASDMSLNSLQVSCSRTYYSRVRKKLCFHEDLSTTLIICIALGLVSNIAVCEHELVVSILSTAVETSS